MLAVYTAEQAAEVIRAASGAPILILMPLWEIDRTDQIYRYLVEGRLHLTVHGADHLAAIDRIAWRFGTVIPLHIDIDTGMSRGGSTPDEVVDMFAMIAKSRWLKLAGISTHFSSADADDDSAREQLKLFKSILGKHRTFIPGDCLIHAASTSATFRCAKFHLGMVRVGIAWMGFGEELLHCGERANEQIALQPAITWSSRIVHIKSIQKGETVGYGRRWQAERPTRLGLVPVGYADGYPSMFGRTGEGDADAPGAQVGIRGPGGRVAFAPVVGAVNMDQITIDLTDVPAGQVEIGTAVELISPDPAAPNHVPRLAQLAGCVPHEILTRINPRLRRLYIVRAAEIETAPGVRETPASIAV
jgi:alanine racemase